MPDNTHTQGPWTLDETANGWTLLANGGEITADHFDCSKADAHLIAAAPDLLAALEAVLPDLWDGIELATEQGVNEAWLEGALHRLDAARAAVNKAKGFA